MSHYPKSLIILLLIHLGWPVFAQETQTPLKCNTINYHKIMVINRYKKTYSMGSASQLQKAFGRVQPKKEPDEVLGGFGYTYQYKGLVVYFAQNSWDGMTINGPGYQVLLNGQAYAVGEGIGKLKKYFPLSYKYKNWNNARRIYIQVAGTDTGVSIGYDSNEKITDISIENDNS